MNFLNNFILKSLIGELPESYFFFREVEITY
jgi:hypothetical protein